MQHGLPVIAYISILGFILLFLLSFRTRSGEAYTRKLAKIRIPVDDRHRQHTLPPDDDLETPLFVEWMLLAIALLLLLIDAST